MVKIKLKSVIVLSSLLSIGVVSASLLSSCGLPTAVERYFCVDGVSFKNEVSSTGFANEYCTPGPNNLDYSEVPPNNPKMLDDVQSMISAKMFMYLMTQDFLAMSNTKTDEDWGKVSNISLSVAKDKDGCFILSEYWIDDFNWSNDPETPDVLQTNFSFFSKENAELKISRIATTMYRDSLSMTISQVSPGEDLLWKTKWADGSSNHNTEVTVSSFTYTIDYGVINYMFPNSSWPITVV